MLPELCLIMIQEIENNKLQDYKAYLEYFLHRNIFFYRSTMFVILVHVLRVHNSKGLSLILDIVINNTVEQNTQTETNSML